MFSALIIGVFCLTGVYSWPVIADLDTSQMPYPLMQSSTLISLLTIVTVLDRQN